MRSSLILGMDSPDVTLAACGGKGINLARLLRAGFPVPPGFVLSTEAYRCFVADQDLQSVIDDACAGLEDSDLRGLEAASTRIRAAFSASVIPEQIVAEVRQAWAEAFPAGAALAVRSSATSEDLPELSFAGQQETSLNVIGLPALLAAILDCWSSLWTPRAIGYRNRAGIDHRDVSIAVIVQRMVSAEVSGVLFTVNPLTGARNEAVIDATFGLGESLVSGQIEPDHIVVDTGTGKIVRTIGDKAVMTVPLADGGVITRSRTVDDATTLTDAQVKELVALGREVETRFGAPQDIEWVIAEETIHLVQTRPITTLYPVPGDDPDSVWISFGAIQGMLQPITPLGRDALGLLLSGVSEVVGPRIDLAASGYLRCAAERLWIRYDRVMRHPWGMRHAVRVLPMIEPSLADIVTGISQDKGWGATSGRPSAASVQAAVRVASLALPRAVGAAIRPQRMRQTLEATADQLIAAAALRHNAAGQIADPWARLAARIRDMRAILASALPQLLAVFLPVMLPAFGVMARLRAIAATVEKPSLVLELLRGLPGNVTTEMDLALWDAATRIQADPEALAAFKDWDVATLTGRAVSGELPGAAQQVVDSFLARYGMRGVGEIDLGRPRWRQAPEAVIQTLRSYVLIDDPGQAPDEVYERGKAAAAQALDDLVSRCAAGKGLRSRATAAGIQFMVSRMRALLGARETPKFTLVRLSGGIREGLLESGRDLVELGVLEEAEDIFYLHLDELERFGQEPAEPWRAVIAARREIAQREQRRGQVPRVLMGDGRAFYAGIGSSQDAIVGSPVSPGVVEGDVRVIFDPRSGGLRPGEILVCPGTDPAWTPLFLVAGGLVTEVGGMMTHGSVVAREYGIPAVVGVHEATSRLRTGWRIRLDGTSGSIEILDPDRGRG